MTTDSEKKPREFWILPQKGNDCDWTNLYPDESWKSGTKPLIHVREVTPCPNCERLEAKYQEKNDDFRATFLKCLNQQEEIQRLQKQLEMCKSDTERLEWMFSHGTALWDTSKFSNFREAIDAAMAKLEKE